MRVKVDKTTSKNGGDTRGLNNSLKKLEPDIL